MVNRSVDVYKRQPELYAIGTFETSSEYDPLLSKGQLVISCEDADSYRYHNEETIVNLTGSGTLIIENDFMPVVPAVSYTHLDVYKRQSRYKVLLQKILVPTARAGL